MASLERFFNPVVMPVTFNLTVLPGALMYFYENNSDSPKSVYQDKEGTIPHESPVVADPSGAFPPIFLDGLYSAELKSSSGVTQDGWPVNNVGLDDILVAANISASNFSSTTAGVTWSDLDGKINIYFAPATFRAAIGLGTIPDMQALADAAQDSADDAEAAAVISAGVANLKGEWSTLVGALAKPASVTYSDGKIYCLLVDLADVTSVTPGTDPATWYDYTSSITGGTVVSSPTDTTAGRITNTGWNFGRAVYGIAPVDQSANGSFDIDAAIPIYGTPYLVDRTVNAGTFPDAITGASVLSVLREDLTYSGTSVQYLYPYTQTTGHGDVAVIQRRFRTTSPAGFTAWEFSSGGADQSNEAQFLEVDLGDVAVSGSETIDFDLSLGNRFVCSMESSNTTGTLTFTVSNAPTAPWEIEVKIRRAGRKTIAWPSGWGYNQSITPTLDGTTLRYSLFNVRKEAFFTGVTATITLLTQQVRP